MPTISTKKTTRTFTSRQSMERETLVFLIASSVAAGTIILHLLAQSVVTHVGSSALARVETSHRSDRILKVAEAAARFEEEREIAGNAKTENTAWEKRAKEFERRLDLDPEFVKSPREEIMMKMKELGAQSDVPAAKALEDLARLALPADMASKPVVKVNDEKGAISVGIGYPCDIALKRSPTGNKWMPGYYREVVLTTAGIVKDVMAFGGSRGLQEITVSCYTKVEVVKKGGTGSDVPEQRPQFGVSATPGGHDWVHMSRMDVEQVWNKKTDNLRSMLLKP
jgi:hypothetical protein